MSGLSTNEWLRVLVRRVERMVDLERAAALGERAADVDVAIEASRRRGRGAHGVERRRAHLVAGRPGHHPVTAVAVSAYAGAVGAAGDAVDADVGTGEEIAVDL